MAIALAIRSAPILQSHSLVDLFMGTVWRPMNGQFGFLSFIAGTFWVTTVGIILAVPPSLLTAFYLSEYALKFTRNIIKPLLDVLAAIPPVIYSVWGTLVIVPFVQNTLMPFASHNFGSKIIICAKTAMKCGRLSCIILRWLACGKRSATD